MVDKIYGVARNGLCCVKEYKVIKESPKTYRIEGGLYEVINKEHMHSKYELFFTDKQKAEKAYNDIVNPRRTNADQIRSMTDEELSIFLCSTGWRIGEDKKCLEWLSNQKEVMENE